MNNALMFSKASDEWRTPQDFFEALDAEFGFDVDAAASAENRWKESYFGLDHHREGCRDALAIDWWPWGKVFWLNPPYSKCREFITKAAWETKKGCTTVCLVPSRTDTRWWQRYFTEENGRIRRDKTEPERVISTLPTPDQHADGSRVSMATPHSTHRPARPV